MKQVTAIPEIEIRFPKNGKLRSRKVVSRSNAVNSGKYPSWKMERMMQWESIHEGNAMRILDATPRVISFNEQPCEIIYTLNGMKRRHYPDFMVIEQQSREFWEVKTERDANDPDVAARTRFLTVALAVYGYGYRMVLAETLGRKSANLWRRSLALNQLSRDVRRKLPNGKRKHENWSRSLPSMIWLKGRMRI